MDDEAPGWTVATIARVAACSPFGRSGSSEYERRSAKRRSASEVRYLLDVAHRLGFLRQADYAILEPRYDETVRALQGLIRSLESEALPMPSSLGTLVPMAARRPKKYRGVYLSRTGLYRALGTTRPGETTYLGNWPTAREAAIAVDRATLHCGRDDLELNLPDESRKVGPLSPEGLVEEARRSRKKQTASSEYVGVCKLQKFELWTAFAHVAGKGESVHLGTFREERDAAIAHDRYVLGAQGPDAPRNFPRMKLKPATPKELRDWARRRKQEPRAGRYAGVTLRDWNTNVPWAASLRVEGRAVYLGAWRTPKAAATAHDRAALYYHGDAAFLNFPATRAELVPASAAELRIEANQKRKRKTSSRYIGVSWVKRDRCWIAVVEHHGNYRRIGRFDDEKEAAQERDRAALRLLGDDATLNFHPRTGEEVFGLRFRDIVEKEASQSWRRRAR